MKRLILAALGGYLAWSVLWIVSTGAAFAEETAAVERGERFDEPGPLAACLALSIVCSLLGGFVAAKLGGQSARGALWTNGILLLVTGIAVQAGVWSLMPVWYHLSFLALLVPVTLLGGKLGGSRRVAPARAS